MPAPSPLPPASSNGRLSTSEWLRYFERNAAQRMAIPWEQGISVEPHLREPLIRSLQRFQVGETGEGVHLRRSAASTGDSTYAQAIELFVREEQEHARLLARLIEAMGGTLLRWHWSDAAFVALRRLAGLRLELMVLLIAEMIAKRYYRALHEGTSDAVLKAAFAQIVYDEYGHVAFHCDTLHAAFAPLPIPLRLLMHMAWWAAFRAVCLLVMLDHSSVLRAAGVSKSDFWRDCGQIFDDTAARIFYSVLEQATADPAAVVRPGRY